jgi:hypothetical protein
MGEVMSEWQAELLTDEKLEIYWPFIQQELQRVPHIWSRRWTIEWFWQAANSGFMQVWGLGPQNAIHVVAFTQIAVYPAARAISITLLFGHGVDKAIPLLSATLQQFARSQECEFIECVGRAGWTKKLPSVGAKVCGMAFEQQVESARMH